jgi:hypothetical protein
MTPPVQPVGEPLAENRSLDSAQVLRASEMDNQRALDKADSLSVRTVVALCLVECWGL